MARPFEVLLTMAATALAAAFFLSVPHWPAAWTQRAPRAEAAGIMHGPSVLANADPAPTLNLAFPDDLATVVARRGINGETGLIPSAAAVTTFRLRATGDIVTIAAPTGVDAVRRVSLDADPALRVRGAYAASWNARGATVVRWTEKGVTYEMSSRTLDAARLAELAEALR